MSVAALVMAAGASTRLGRPKQLVRLNGEALLERAVRVARAAGCSPVVVVLGAHPDAIEQGCAFGSAVIVRNAGWGEGMASTIRAGVATLPRDVEGVLLLACDQPAVTSDHLCRLMETSERSASFYAGRVGVPAYFPAIQLDALRRLQGEFGARDLLAEARRVDLFRGELDVDTEEQLDEAKRLFASERVV